MSTETVSIVVPAYKEKENITPLTKRVLAAFKKDATFSSVELIIVDDNSRDGSVEAVEALQKEGFNVKILVRVKERGLSSAVIHGINAAKGSLVLVMDADLQHPPESAPKLAIALAKPGVEFSLGTRYGKGVAIDKDWPTHRRVISWGARLLARPLTAMSDPMSGFFAIRKSVFAAHQREISGIGYKIALELFVKCQVQRFEEVPFSFAAREFGESKLTGKVIVHYLMHLWALYQFALGPQLWLLLAALVALVLFVLNQAVKLLL